MIPITTPERIEIPMAGITCTPTIDSKIINTYGIRFTRSTFPVISIVVALIGQNASPIKVIKNAGITIITLALNFAFILIFCVVVAAIVVSEMKDKLSPNIAPPTTIPQTSGTLTFVLIAILKAIGIKADTVPIDVPIEKLKIQPIKNKPGKINCAGKIEIPKLVTVSVACIAPATP